MNHPQRNWRRRANEAADQWQDSPAGKLLAEGPLDPERRVEGLRARLRIAYLAGYDAGRKPREPKS